MKPFFKSFFRILLPLLILVELAALILPPSTPYGLFIVSRVGMTLIGAIIAITVLKRKHKQVNFGKSFLAGLVVIIIGFLISVAIYSFSFEVNYRYDFSEVLGTFLLFMLGQIFVLLTVLLMAGMWYALQKAGQPGFAMLIPIYNIIVILEVAKKPVWWIVLLLIPIVNIVFMIMMLNGVSKQFGKSEGFTVGLVFMSGIFWAILGYGDAKHTNQQLQMESEGILD